eukprot:CAMPEP_0117501298 /NCGR_PEP_ID=MMETSP0784-20121206/23226_1 /TAXON_ID=39447 /ORGANISM="" /LENGTH=197 /DNA_ID=CAMNT_0005296547 /DNA_START=107 /DNA_END=700 /DNA_ORIENTATION=-
MKVAKRGALAPGRKTLRSAGKKIHMSSPAVRKKPSTGASSPAVRKIMQRAKARGGKLSTSPGSVSVSLVYDDPSKKLQAGLDVVVTAPSGEKLCWKLNGGPSTGKQHNKSACGGEMDVDAYCGEGNPSPIQNIVWTKNAPKGKYVVHVSNCHPLAGYSKAIPFQVGIVMDGGAMDVISKTVPGGRSAWVYVKTFRYA